MRPRRRFYSFKPELSEGIISLHRDGYGFVQKEDGSEIFIPAEKVNFALPGDKVLVKSYPARERYKKRQGSVEEILERKLVEFVGIFNGSYVVPRQEEIIYQFFVSEENSQSAKPGELVRARIISYPSPSKHAEAEIVEILGRELSPDVESKLILREFGFPEDFGKLVQNELIKIPKRVLTKDLNQRQDLRNIPLITIDPEDAKDFDDAVAVKKTGSGFKLWVAIADVSYYVKSGSSLDQEAYQRGTSVYFPDRAIPMLPEEISAGVASLKPEEDRLAMVVEMTIDTQGKILASEFYPALIRSRFRMNYQEVQAILDHTAPELNKKYSKIEGMLREMAQLAEILFQRRQRRGGMDLDLPEAKVKLDEKGEPIDIYPYPRLFSHRIIEEFMLAANQAVAEFLFQKKLAFPYRIHEPPEMKKIIELNNFLSGLGVPLLKHAQSAGQIHPLDFQKVFKQVANQPFSSLVSYLVLRSMMQAKYSPTPQGHFGLALNHYCHFTSPIRRYPDLMVHRILKHALGLLPFSQAVAPEELASACEHCSARERASIDAEREMLKVYQARLLSKHLGEKFKGIISGLTDFGVFVEIERPMAEGLIPAITLPGYVLNEKLNTAFIKFSPKELHLADQVLVKVQAVDLIRKEIDFAFCGIIKSAFSRSIKAWFPSPEKTSVRKRQRGKRNF